MLKKIKPMTIDGLARITQAGFLGVGRRIDGLEQKVDGLEQNTKNSFRGILEILDAMQADLKYVKNSTRNLPLLEREVQDLQQRMVRLERRSGMTR